MVPQPLPLPGGQPTSAGKPASRQRSRSFFISGIEPPMAGTSASPSSNCSAWDGLIRSMDETYQKSFATPGSVTVASSIAEREPVRNLKLFILLFGALGLASAFIPGGGFTLFEAWKAAGTGQLVIMLVAFALPVAMGIIGLAKPPAAAWQGIVALAGFALAGFKMEVWKGIGEVMELPINFKLLLVAVFAGAVVSLLATIKPENKL